MGFRNGAYATVWDVKPGASKSQRCRISISRKDKSTDQLVQDFSGYCDFWGNAAAMAQRLKPKDRIKLVSVDVTNKYDKDAGKEYINYKVFEFENAESKYPQGDAGPASGTMNAHEGDVSEDGLPF